MSNEAGQQRIREPLLQNKQFTDMPSGLQEVILHSSTTSRQFETFFSKGGIIRDDESEELAYYSGAELPEIVVSQFKYQEARLPHRDDMCRSLFSIMAHEIGHDAINYEAHPFRGSTEEEYVSYRAEHEALAIHNTFVIFNGLKEVMKRYAFFLCVMVRHTIHDKQIPQDNKRLMSASITVVSSESGAGFARSYDKFIQWKERHYLILIIQLMTLRLTESMHSKSGYPT
jgi:hypothetical protein